MAATSNSDFGLLVQAILFVKGSNLTINIDSFDQIYIDEDREETFAVFPVRFFKLNQEALQYIINEVEQQFEHTMADLPCISLSLTCALSDVHLHADALTWLLDEYLRARPHFYALELHSFMPVEYLPTHQLPLTITEIATDLTDYSSDGTLCNFLNGSSKLVRVCCVEEFHSFEALSCFFQSLVGNRGLRELSLPGCLELLDIVSDSDDDIASSSVSDLDISKQRRVIELLSWFIVGHDMPIEELEITGLTFSLETLNEWTQLINASSLSMLAITADNDLSASIDHVFADKAMQRRSLTTVSMPADTQSPSRYSRTPSPGVGT